MPSNITRRAAIGAIASISATGAAGAAFASGQSTTPENAERALAGPSCPQIGESPADKVERLAEEMSVALDEWLDAWAGTRPEARRPLWHARVWPASSDRGHVLINDRALRPGPDGPNDAKLAELEAAWIENDREWNKRLKAVTAAQDAGEDITALEASADLLAARDMEIFDEMLAIPADSVHGVMIKLRMPTHAGCRIDGLLPSVTADIERIAGGVA